MRPGRPRLDVDALTVRVSLRVTPAQRRDLRRVACLNHTDVAGVLRDAVNDYVADFRDGEPVFRLLKP